jgi:hypothetical protein
VGTWWVQARRGGLLVLHGPSRAALSAVIDAVAAAARADGVAQRSLDEPGPGGAWVAAPPDAPAPLLLRAAQAARVVYTSDRPQMRLAAAGATHVAVPAAPSTGEHPAQRRLLAALADGPRSVDDLARALDLGALDLLELAEPLLRTGQVEERRSGRMLARPDRG